MSTATESNANPFQDAMENMRQATMSALQMQQEMHGHWAKMWSGGTPQTDWNSGVKKLQADWLGSIKEMMNKHREMLDEQYRVGIESLEEAFRVAGSKDPEELRAHCETLCRMSFNLMKETTEKQLNQFQEAMKTWVESCQVKH